MSYKPLQNIFHASNEKKLYEEYTKRLESPSTFNTNISINPISNGQRVKEKEFPLFFVITKELSIKQEYISNKSKEIDNALNSIPPPGRNQYYNDLLIDELQSTNEIENVYSTKQEIADALNNKKSKLTKFRGLVDQYKEIELKKSVTVDSIKDIRNIYDKLVSNEVAEQDKLDGEMFRKSFVGVEDGSTGEYIHVGVEPETKIIEYLSDMLSFLKYNDAPAPFKIMASHYLFEYIHPFYDGNGRVGRFIIAKLLSDYYDNYTALTFSYVINRNKTKYYKEFLKTSNQFNCGDLTSFIESMFDLLIEGQDRILSDLIPKVEITEKLKAALFSDDFKIIESKFLYYLSIDKLFGDKRNRLSLIDFEDLLEVGRTKINNLVTKFETDLNKVKGNPVVYEINDYFLERLIND